MALVPVYLLQFCYGLHTGYPAILTPQLREPCSEMPITEEQESWIGEKIITVEQKTKVSREQVYSLTWEPKSVYII